MKQSFSTALCVCLAVILSVAAICVGAVRGWQGERTQTLNAFSDGGSVYVQLDERAMDAANLSVVAARHLPKDEPSLVALQDARRVLISTQSDLNAKADADAVLSNAAEALAQTLLALDSVQASPRDLAYITTLTRSLAEATTLAADYAEAARAFNQRLSSSLTGKLAMCFGIQALPEGKVDGD